MEAADHSHRRLSEATRRRLTAGLVRGRQRTARLQNLLRSADATEHNRRELADEILKSFTEAISDLNSSQAAGDDLSCADYSLSSDLDSGDSRRSPAAFHDRGRGHKRRRVAETRIVMAPTLEDDRAWRKYGQKAILNATHPRSYYRCTHKYDEGCGATKHVQKMEGDSELYKITYISNHTCGQANSPIAAALAAAEHPLSAASNSYNICFSDSVNNDDRQYDGGIGRSFWSSNDAAAAAKGGETTSGVTDETDLWSDLKDFGNLYCFSIGDDADSSVFGMEF